MEPDYWQQFTLIANGDEREWFDKHFPNIVKRAKELTKISVRNKMLREVCRKGSVAGILWEGGTELAVYPINWSRDNALPDDAERRAKTHTEIFDSDLGDEPQSWWHGFTKLGAFTFRGAVQAILINSQIDVPDDVQSKGKDCSYFSYSFVMEARDVLGVPLPGFEARGTRASWIVEDTIKCCKRDCRIVGGKFYWPNIPDEE
jgi:hypothetical protein